MPTQLPCGLSVQVEERRAAAVVALQLWVKVGAADEQPAEAGLAYLVQRLLSRGAIARSGDDARLAGDSGVEPVSSTSFDQTVYQVTVASAAWLAGMELLAGVLRDPVFEPAALARLLDEISAELERAEASPGRALTEALFDAAYEEHPYGLPVTGEAAGVRLHTREAVQRFIRRWYQPQNMVLVVVGDVGEAEVLEAAARLFPGGPAIEPSATLATRPRRAEPKHGEPLARVLRAKVPEAQVRLAWPAPPMGHEDLPAIDALVIALGLGETSRLARAMKIERALVGGLNASCFTARDRGLAMLSLSLPAENLREAVREASEQLHRLRVEELSTEELERACRQLEANALRERELAQARAHRLGLSLCNTGGLELEQLYFRQLQALTPLLAREAAQRWFEPRELVGAALLPLEADESFEFQSFQELLEELAAVAGAEELPATESQVAGPARARPAKRIRVGEPAPLIREELPGGGVLLIREERAVPLVALHACWSGGQRAETAAEGGAQMMLARLAAKETATRGAEQLALELDALGGSLEGSVGRDSFSLGAEALAQQFAPAWALFAEALAAPSFRAAGVERERARQQAELRARDADLAGAVFQLFSETLYRKHPYRLEVLGNQQSLARLDGAKLEAIRRQLYPAGAAVLAVVGDVDPSEVRARVVESLGAAGVALAPQVVAQEPEQSGPRVAVRALERAPAHLIVGFPGLSIGSPDGEALELLVALLSGPRGRVACALRDQRIAARGASALSMEGVDPGWIAVHVGCGPGQVMEALACIREQLARLQEQLPEARELERARNQLLTSRAINLQRGPLRAAQLAFDECCGQDAGWSRGYAERVSAVSAERLRALARRVLLPARETVALVADVASLPGALVEQARGPLASNGVLARP